MPRVLHTALLVCLVTWVRADLSGRQCDGEDGTFGPSCSEQCPANCRPDSEKGTCHSTHGYCTSGCKDGWGGRYCNETCLSNCKRCSMMKASNCVQCFHGFQGPHCIESFDDGHHGHSLHSKDRGPSKAFVDTAVGIAFGFFLLLLLMLVLGYTNRHKCRTMLKQKKDGVMFVQDELGSQQSLDFLEDGEPRKNMMI